jgi:hypothetical protein
MKKLFGILIIIGGILLALYLGLWVMFIHPIKTACKAYDVGMLTGMLLGKTILLCIFASVVGGFIAWLSIVIGGILIETSSYSHKNLKKGSNKIKW